MLLAPRMDSAAKVSVHTVVAKLVFLKDNPEHFVTDMKIARVKENLRAASGMINIFRCKANKLLEIACTRPRKPGLRHFWFLSTKFVPIELH